MKYATLHNNIVFFFFFKCYTFEPFCINVAFLVHRNAYLVVIGDSKKEKRQLSNEIMNFNSTLLFLTSEM